MSAFRDAPSIFLPWPTHYRPVTWNGQEPLTLLIARMIRKDYSRAISLSRTMGTRCMSTSTVFTVSPTWYLTRTTL